MAYDPSASELRATTYQAAVDELAGQLATLSATLVALEDDLAGLAPVATSGSYLDLADTPDVCAKALACPQLATLAADLWCFKNCDPQRLGDCRARTCDGAAETCTDAGALPDGTAWLRCPRGHDTTARGVYSWACSGGSADGGDTHEQGDLGPSGRTATSDA